MRRKVSIERLRGLLEYNPSTGVFVWSVTRGAAKKGSVAGTNTSNGLFYRQIMVDGVLYLAHRLAWFYMHEAWPEGVIDHINGNPADNRIENLRVVSVLVNQQNQKRAHRSNKFSRLIGVSASRNKWRARIKITGKDRYIGTFETQEQAHAAYVAAKRSHHEGGVL